MPKSARLPSDDEIIVKIARCKIPPKRASKVLARFLTCLELASKSKDLKPKSREVARRFVTIIVRMCREELR